MLLSSDRKRSRTPLFLASLAALTLALSSVVIAQETQPATAAQTQTTQTPTQPPAATNATATTTSQTTQTPAAPAPLYSEFKGVKLGMSAAEVRAKLGKPEVQSDEVDIFVFSERERARVHYDKDKKANAVIATYIGKDASAPTSAAVLGAEVEAKPNGSAYQMTTYPQAGYWVAYSRTPGDSPMVIITMQKTP